MYSTDHHSLSTFTQSLKAQALSLGFSAMGNAHTEPLVMEEVRLRDWLKKEYHGSMKWLARDLDKRLNPTLVFSETQSVIVVAMNYWTDCQQPIDPQYGKISRYAWGSDYHVILREKLSKLLQWMQKQNSSIRGKLFVDSGQLLEKAWAVRSGLGWMGKNTTIISKKLGSFIFLGIILLNIPLEDEQPVPDACGTCTKCIDACPTGALVAPYILDASHCISYLTVEHRGEIPEQFRFSMNNWIFGCDICQDVCPWNQTIQNRDIEEFYPLNGLLTTSLSQMERLTEEEFKDKFKDSSIARTRHHGFIRNVKIALKNMNERSFK
ncbi:MAG: tRNA epoxyqueuosine(34) reductase QueG [Patescibacteria group bacterium]|nr:tRNA epoxyqueuosine(34) reductase QueG [Patescibacteria group bacterium]